MLLRAQILLMHFLAQAPLRLPEVLWVGALGGFSLAEERKLRLKLLLLRVPSTHTLW